MLSRALDMEFRPYRDGDDTAFRTLNEEWIAEFFGFQEAKDRETLGDPVGRVLRPSGHVFMATAHGEAVGCCALLFKEPGVFELAKMAVRRSWRGQGVGRRLLEHVVVQARRLGARSLYLETNHTLRNAIHLYESIGFRHLPPERLSPSPYVRADVFMEMEL
jgi:putative acetyltransferase